MNHRTMKGRYGPSSNYLKRGKRKFSIDVLKFHFLFLFFFFISLKQNSIRVHHSHLFRWGIECDVLSDYSFRGGDI
jgi:hypothetical protein